MYEVLTQLQDPESLGGAFHQPGETVDLSRYDPEERARLEREGTVRRLPDTAPLTLPPDPAVPVVREGVG
jgi:hypothetical protein